MINIYSSPLTCRILNLGLSHLSSVRFLTLRRGNCNPSMPVSVPFLQPPLDVILVTIKWKEMHGKEVVFITQPERSLSKAAFLSRVCLAHICPWNPVRVYNHRTVTVCDILGSIVLLTFLCWDDFKYNGQLREGDAGIAPLGWRAGLCHFGSLQ